MLDRLTARVEEMREENPGVTITLSDVMRSLIIRGLRNEQ